MTFTERQLQEALADAADRREERMRCERNLEVLRTKELVAAARVMRLQTELDRMRLQ